MDINIVAIDKDVYALKRLAANIRTIAPKCNLALYATPEDALRYASLHKVDIVLLENNFFSMNGRELALRLKMLNPRINIIFTAETDDFAIEAFRLHASGYLRKPVSAKEIKAELDNLRYPPEPVSNSKHEQKLRIKCFGSFEVFGPDNIPLAFPRLRCKEALAYLVDRAGAGVTIRQLSAVLWEGREFDLNLQKQVQTILASLMKTLKHAGASSVISKKRNNIAVLPDMVECDYYKFLKGEPSAREQYIGEYMSQYSWGEYTNGDLWRLQNNSLRDYEKKESNFVEL